MRQTVISSREGPNERQNTDLTGLERLQHVEELCKGQLACRKVVENVENGRPLGQRAAFVDFVARELADGRLLRGVVGCFDEHGYLLLGGGRAELDEAGEQSIDAFGVLGQEGLVTA